MRCGAPTSFRARPLPMVRAPCSLAVSTSRAVLLTQGGSAGSIDRVAASGARSVVESQSVKSQARTHRIAQASRLGGGGERSTNG